MSRTYRKHSISFQWMLDNDWYFGSWKQEQEYSVRKKRAIYRQRENKGGRWDMTLPHDFRNDVNRQRRAVDKRELYKEVHKEDYVGNYDPWNCKTSNSWGYW